MSHLSEFKPPVEPPWPFACVCTVYSAPSIRCQQGLVVSNMRCVFGETQPASPRLIAMCLSMQSGAHDEALHAACEDAASLRRELDAHIKELACMQEQVRWKFFLVPASCGQAVPVEQNVHACTFPMKDHHKFIALLGSLLHHVPPLHCPMASRAFSEKEGHSTPSISGGSLVHPLQPADSQSTPVCCMHAGVCP